MSMNEIVPNLWVGDLPSALDTETLRAHNIRSVLTAMRGRVSIHETFVRHQINIDDTDSSDILQHFVPAITFIQAELDKGKGVLVHCQAGMSRSVAIVAAYLMVTESLDAESALEVIRKARPNVQPNEGFMRQLEIFHQASFKVSKRDKETRLFYLERVVNEVMNGDGEFETEMFAKFPYTPSDTPVPPPRRRIRCKMCRQELAAREHMLDHGQVGPPTPAVLSAANSRRPSMNDPKPLSPLASGATAPRRASSSGGVKPLVQGPPAAPSSGLSRSNSLHESHPRSRLGSISELAENRPVQATLLQLDSASASVGRSASDLLSESAFDEDSSDEEPPQSESEPVSDDKPIPSTSPEAKAGPTKTSGAESATAGKADTEFPPTEAAAESADKVTPLPSQRPPISLSNSFAHPTDLAAQLAAHPKLAALRPPAGLSMTPLAPAGGSSPTRSAPQSPGLASVKSPNYFASISPPILANPKCSGYFVEPMKWMEPFLEQGHMAGKIICPNKKCGAKLGNYDWAGVCCSCKEWVVPGFCIHRSKVDEVV
ncbi:hypothetical protein BD309DRAFT_928271 [Dichomitus squalens]|uniref:protein-tyrosine-phosphatase n=1 Tax=Dichomitus squalens TaxID=114155 RepID=A0A4V2K7A1_9APHY|nr:hypothetical protein BD309DRAFT_928271 [Dichomitus squalens]TBU55368.1 hypothetical protein BD310DRAFT_1041185 [Dichomitus squalens]